MLKSPKLLHFSALGVFQNDFFVLKLGFPCGPAGYTRTFEAFSEHERHLLGVSTLSVFHEKSAEHIFIETALSEP